MKVLWRSGVLRGNQKLTIEVSDDEIIKCIELISNGGQLVASSSFNSYHVLYEPVVNTSSGAYFYVKVYEDNTLDSDSPEQITITSSILFE